MAEVPSCQQVARLPNLVKSAIESVDVPIKRSYLLFVLDLEIIFIVSNITDVWYIWAMIALSFRIFYSSNVLTSESRLYILKKKCKAVSMEMI